MITLIGLTIASLALILFLRRSGRTWPAATLGTLTALWLAGNLSVAAAFCDPQGERLFLSRSSPCAPDGDVPPIGAWPVGCDELPTRASVERE